jgi:hypothetical protein
MPSVLTHNSKIKDPTSFLVMTDNESMPGQTAGMGSPAFAMFADTSHIVQCVRNVQEARALPRGSVIGDVHGGLTFTDAVAAVLEARSAGGWQEVQTPRGETWTIIVLSR